MRHCTSPKFIPAILALGLLVQPLATTQAQQSASSQITDVELKSDSSFQGKPVDARGQVQPNTPVTIQNVQTGQVVRTTTAADGTFGVQNLPPGVYDVSVGQMTSTVRVWPFQAAPAGSVQQVAYQVPPQGALPPANNQNNQQGGGFGGGGLFSGNNLLIGGAIIGVTAGIIIAVTAS
ncbi:MAG: carboxypeptidase regulatory-like domain-containing protein [Rhodopirellula sp.]|nr:carboxypeptidase regulatory-like domain-containing protein [Rhodopirellula sp.]